MIGEHFMTTRLIFFLTFLASTSALAAEAKSNLCSSEETVVFSCSVSKKLVSLCATPGIAAKTGRLTYRFGVVGSIPELEFSNNEQGPASAFTAYFYDWAKGSYSSISFKRGEYTYTVYNRTAAFEENDQSNGGGIQIFGAHKQVADLWCENDSIHDQIWEILKKLSLPNTPAP
jgi:hypothetical protein